MAALLVVVGLAAGTGLHALLSPTTSGAATTTATVTSTTTVTRTVGAPSRGPMCGGLAVEHAGISAGEGEVWLRVWNTVGSAIDLASAEVLVYDASGREVGRAPVAWAMPETLQPGQVATVVARIGGLSSDQYYRVEVRIPEGPSGSLMVKSKGYRSVHLVMTFAEVRVDGTTTIAVANDGKDIAKIDLVKVADTKIDLGQATVSGATVLDNTIILLPGTTAEIRAKLNTAFTAGQSVVIEVADTNSGARAMAEVPATP